MMPSISGWKLADKPFSDMATLPAEIHTYHGFGFEDRTDRAGVNEAVRRHRCDRRPD